MEKFVLSTPYIQLNQLLKMMGWVESGAEANHMIDTGLVFVNGVQEFRKRNKIMPGLVVEFEGQKVEVQAA
jgi:ribosome-associated protein